MHKWRFYVITLLILTAAAYPLWNLAGLLLHYYDIRRIEFGRLWAGWVCWIWYDVTMIIPFAAVSAAILLGFLLTPMLKNRLAIFAVATGIFVGLELYVSQIAARLDLTNLLLTSRRGFTPAEIAVLSLDMAIAWTVRMHYYVFSIIFILSVLNLLYWLAINKESKPNKRNIVIQSIVVVSYALAYIFVRTMQHADPDTLLLTGWSVLNAAICFALAAIAAGLCAASFTRFKGFGKYIPSILSVSSILVLYAAQYVMLGGNLYLYHENAVITIFLRILITATPAIIVFYLHKKSGGFTPPPSPRSSSSQ